MNGEGFAIDADGRLFVTQHGRDQLHTNWPELYKPDEEATLPSEEAMLLKHDASGALAEFQQEPSDVWKTIGLAMAFHAAGRVEEANAALEHLIARYEEGSSFNIAEVYAFRGEPNKAFEWLDKAVTYQDTGLAIVPLDPLLESLHQDPRWSPFLRKIGRAPDQLAAVKFDIRIPGE